MYALKIKSVLILIFIFSVFLILCFKISFLSDDAFISYRYAKNFINGEGLVFNSGERVEGYTNFLWVMFSAVFIKSGIDPLRGARIISILSAFLVLVITFLIAKEVFKISGLISYLGVTMLALNPGFVLWTYSGMETIFFTLLVTAGIFFTLLFLGNNKNRYLIYSSVLFSLSALTRPEGVYFFFLNSLFLLISFWSNRSKERFLGLAGRLLLPVVIFLVIYGSYFIWRFSYYGYIFPNTFYAKTGFDNQILRGLYYCFKFYRESMAMGLLLIFPVYLIIKERRNKKIIYVLFIILGYLLYVILIGGDNLLVQRFIVPVMPLIYTLIMLGLYRFFRDYSIRFSMKFIITALIIFSSLFVIVDSRTFPMYGVSSTLSHYENMKRAALWLKENAAPDETLAVESAGIIPYYSELKSYDRLGLSDLYISHKGKYEGGAKEKNDEEYILLKRQPTYFIDAFPTLGKKEKPDLRKGDIVYKYHSVLIGKGTVEEKPGVKEDGELYFNFYKKTE